MQLVSHGTVIASTPGTPRQSCCFPSVCVLETGRWIVGFRAAPTKGATWPQHSLLMASDDQGRSWSEPIEPAQPPTLDGRVGCFRAIGVTALGGNSVLATFYWVDASNPDLPLFNEATEGLLDSRLFWSRSDDGGVTWSDPSQIDTGYADPTPITGPTLLLPDGTWACQFELNKHYNDPKPWQHKSCLVFSRDQGRTWTDSTVVTHDPQRRWFWWDQRPCVLPDGQLLDLFWTYDNVAAQYLNIHGRRSIDGGRTWGELWATNTPGQPAPAVGLTDGRVVMVYVDRTGSPRLMARVSSDGGRTFDSASELVIRQPALQSQTWNKSQMQDAWAEMAKFSLGLPATCRLPEGDVLTVYYNGPHNDHTNIEWARLRA